MAIDCGDCPGDDVPSAMPLSATFTGGAALPGYSIDSHAMDYDGAGVWSGDTFDAGCTNDLYWKVTATGMGRKQVTAELIDATTSTTLRKYLNTVNGWARPRSPLKLWLSKAVPGCDALDDELDGECYKCLRPLRPTSTGCLCDGFARVCVLTFPTLTPRSGSPDVSTVRLCSCLSGATFVLTNSFSVTGSNNCTFLTNTPCPAGGFNVEITVVIVFGGINKTARITITPRIIDASYPNTALPCDTGIITAQYWCVAEFAVPVLNAATTSRCIPSGPVSVEFF